MTTLAERRARLEQAKLYAIVDLGYIGAAQVPEMTRRLVEGKVDLIQLRAKKLSLPEIVELGREMREVIPADGPIFVLNDHPELVAQVGADGLHLGQDDGPLEPARAAAGRNVIIGRSTHSVEQAVAAEEEGADYIGVGPIFATPTKPDYVPVGPGLIAQVRAKVRVPQFCIGGIKEKTLAEVRAAGAERVVIVSALLQSGDPVGYCRRVREVLAG